MLGVSQKKTLLPSSEAHHKCLFNRAFRKTIPSVWVTERNFDLICTLYNDLIHFNHRCFVSRQWERGWILVWVTAKQKGWPEDTDQTLVVWTTTEKRASTSAPSISGRKTSIVWNIKRSSELHLWPGWAGESWVVVTTLGCVPKCEREEEEKKKDEEEE